MRENRHAHRVRFTSRSSLTSHDATYHGHLENISRNGALVSLDDGSIIPQGSEYILTVYPEDGAAPLKIVVEVIHSSLTMIGVKFIFCEEDSRIHLRELLERSARDPEKIRTEMEKIRGHLTAYLHPSEPATLVAKRPKSSCK